MTNKCECYRVSVFGEQYVLQSDESAQHVLDAAALVESCMKSITARHTTLDSKKVAVLAAIQLASQLLQKDAAVSDTCTLRQDIVALIDQEVRI